MSGEWVRDERTGMYWQLPTMPAAIDRAKLTDPAANMAAGLRYIRARYSEPRRWDVYRSGSYAAYVTKRRGGVRELLRFWARFALKHGRDVVRRWGR